MCHFLLENVPVQMSSFSKHLCYGGSNRSRMKWLASIAIHLLLALTVSAHWRNGSSTGIQCSRKLLSQVLSLMQLDEQIQISAFSSFGNSRTGEIYKVALPSNLTGVTSFAVRLRTGSLKRHGVELEEFNITPGAEANVQAVRVLLVYRQVIGINVYSTKGYMLVSPILGIKVYDAFNLTSGTLMPEVDVFATGAPFTVRIPFLSMAPGSTPLCASFNSNGSFTIANVSSSPNVCSTFHLGDFALVVPLSALAPAPSPVPQPSLSPSAQTPNPGFQPQPPSGSSNLVRHRRSNAWKIAVGSALGAAGFLMILGVVAIMGLNFMESTKIAKMEHEAEQGETLQTSVIGESRAPTAGISRTRPTLETEYMNPGVQE